MSADKQRRAIRQAVIDYRDHDWPVVLLSSWGVGIATRDFDVLAIGSPAGASIHHTVLTRCPTAIARTVRWGWRGPRLGPALWHFYLAPGSLDPAHVADQGARLHHGPDDFVPAPPTRSPLDGLRYGWIVPPMQARWTPYTPTGVFDDLGLVA